MKFHPDYRNILDAAYNRQPKRLPLYEHSIHPSVMEKILGESFAHLYDTDKDAYFRTYCRFFQEMGYDTVISLSPNRQTASVSMPPKLPIRSPY